MIEKLAAKTADFIAGSKGAQKLFQSISNNASQVSVNTSNSVNFIARPITIMATTKSKNLLDGAYCASSSIASGISETLTSKTILKPLNNAISKSTSNLKDSGFFSSIANKVGTSQDGVINSYKSALGRLILIALVPVNSLIKMKLHPPLAKKVKQVTEVIRSKEKKLNVIG